MRAIVFVRKTYRAEKNRVFSEKKKNLRQFRGTAFVMKRAVRQGFETENNITRLSRAILNLRLHSFILTFRCGAAYQP